MNYIIKQAIEKPIAVIALIFLSILFGYVALQNIPIQMTPDIEKPIYQVRVNWPGASPADVDREIVNRLEQDLSSLNGIEELSSQSRTGRATITLTYSLEQDMDKALILLLNKLSGVNSDQILEIALNEAKDICEEDIKFCENIGLNGLKI